MVEQTIEAGTIYDHEKYGEVLVTGIIEVFNEWTVGDSDQSGTPMVNFHVQFDALGGIEQSARREQANIFAESVDRSRQFGGDRNL